ncbi:MAG: protein translocase subunit SecF [Candidatus Marinimicrobia bacterium]|nr:protein translocase subunit SecF [Candidatus Neomarinimicrobiota bacterium]MDD5709799.1 protein translocase subunit SecF [Candidatus Neomarinimicrobiota bacterium]
MLQLFKNTSYDIVNKRRFTFILSLVLIVLGLVSLFVRGLNYGIDFSGGAKMQVEFSQTITAEELRAKFTEKNLRNPEIKSSGNNEYMITLNPENLDDAEIILAEALEGTDYNLLQMDKIGPKIGRELRANSLKAVGIALLLVLIYITVRFEFRFAVGAVVALAHDVLITLGLFSIFQWEISMPVLAAFLTIVGYSLNDTIVIFDRIRENLKVHKGKPITDIINYSINESLSRTVITSVTTFLVVVILALFGGQVLFGFSIAMVIGVIVGTYSSMYIAAPILVVWGHKFKEKEKPEEKKK